MINPRITKVIISLLILLVVFAATYFFSQRFTRSNDLSSVLISINSLLSEREELIKELQANQFVEPYSDILPSYLIKIRRDGVQSHADMKQLLNSLAENTTALATLVDLYEPQSKTNEFRAEAKKVRAYAIAWTDRWNSLMDLFMTGGGYPVTEVPFPDKFLDALITEQKALN